MEAQMERFTKYTRWSESEMNWLKENYKTNTVKEMAAHLGRTYGATREMCNKLRLIKDENDLQKVHSRPNDGQFRKGEIRNLRTKIEKQTVKNERVKKLKKVQKQNEKSFAQKFLKEKKLQVKPFDPSGLISVRVNSKTIIFVKPGTDIEKIKKQYSNDKLATNDHSRLTTPPNHQTSNY